MAKTTRNAAVAMMAAAILVSPRVSGAADATTVNPAAPVPHVRSASPALVAMIQQATERSATFRALVSLTFSGRFAHRGISPSSDYDVTVDGKRFLRTRTGGPASVM